MPPGGAEFTGPDRTSWPVGCPCPIGHRCPKVRDAFPREEVLRSRIGKALGFHGRNWCIPTSSFCVPEPGNRQDTKNTWKLLPAALPCSELQSRVFAGDTGKWENSLSSPAQSIWKTSPLVGTRSLLHPGQGRQETASVPAICAEGQTSPVCGQEPLARAYSRDNYGSLESSCKHGERRKYCIPEDRGGQGGRRPASWLGRLVSCLPFNLPPGDKRHRQEEWGPDPLMNSSCRSTPGPGL